MKLLEERKTGKMERNYDYSEAKCLWTWLHCQVLPRHKCKQHSILTRALAWKKHGPLQAVSSLPELYKVDAIGRLIV